MGGVKLANSKHERTMNNKNYVQNCILFRGI